MTIVHTAGPVTRSELTERMGLSRSTIKALVAELVALGAVTETGPAGARAGAGRPSLVVMPHDAPAHVLAADVGVDRIVVGAYRLGGGFTTSREVELSGGPPTVAQATAPPVRARRRAPRGSGRLPGARPRCRPAGPGPHAGRVRAAGTEPRMGRRAVRARARAGVPRVGDHRRERLRPRRAGGAPARGGAHGRRPALRARRRRDRCRIRARRALPQRRRRVRGRGGPHADASRGRGVPLRGPRLLGDGGGRRCGRGSAGPARRTGAGTGRAPRGPSDGAGTRRRSPRWREPSDVAWGPW